MAGRSTVAKDFDCDVALIGSGLAPLIAARRLLDQGKRVLLLNPDLGYFLEDSELPLDPSWERDAESALRVLRPEYPGALEIWNPLGTTADSGKANFKDAQAPHLRQRNRLWVNSPELESAQPWEELEAFYLQTSEKGFKPQLLEAPQAALRFPGKPSQEAPTRGVLLPRLWDIDVDRYRNGVLEFVRERAGLERVLLEVSGLEFMPEGLRFYQGGEAHTARVTESVLAFWTPRLTAWIEAQAKRLGKERVLPAQRTVELWEQWNLLSRDALDPATAGVFRDLLVWADVEGSPEQRELRELSVLKRNPQTATATLSDLESLCCEFLGWDKFSVRGLRTRRIFNWGAPAKGALSISDSRPTFKVITHCDGPISTVVERAQQVVP